MRQRIAKSAPLTLLLLLGCNDHLASDRVGLACTPEGALGTSDTPGFSPNQTFLQTAAECGSQPCVVHRLDNHTNGAIPADPTLLCDASDPQPGCVEASAVAQSVHCTCRCAGPDDHGDYCRCPNNFVCREVLAEGPSELRGSYCVRPQTSR